MYRYPLATLFILLYASLAAQNYTIEKDIPYRDGATEKLDDYMHERCKLDIYYPEDSTGFATIFWIHGGGLQNGAKHFQQELMDQGMAIVAINYRMYPRAKAPACIDDAAAALAWVFIQIENYGGDPQKIFATGHSAGGYLVSMIGLDKSYLEKYGIDANQVKAYLPLSGQAITHSTIRGDQGYSRTQPVIDHYAPVQHVRADAPPFILITGGRHEDIPARYEENLYLKRIMELAGHQYTQLYELQGFGHVPMVRPACGLIVEYIRGILENQD